MKWQRLSILVLCATFGIWQSAFAAMVSPSLAKTKTEAEARGYIFLTNHDEIISEACREWFVPRIAQDYGQRIPEEISLH
ncbi:MAG: hypothetical protein HW419_4416 [Deltaproteobacteria bacterium]|nr:hypothetical protein [Deltaproteobacteria bacterium]